MVDKPMLQVGDAVIVTMKNGTPQVDDCITPVLQDFLGNVNAVNEDGTVDVDDGDGQVFDSIHPEYVDLVCPDCGEPMGTYMNEGADGTNLEEVYGCKVCGTIHLGGEAHEGECESCVYKDVPETTEPCWSCYNNALVGVATGHNYLPRCADDLPCLTPPIPPFPSEVIPVNGTQAAIVDSMQRAPDTPRTLAELDLSVSDRAAKDNLERMVADGVVEEVAPHQPNAVLFDRLTPNQEKLVPLVDARRWGLTELGRSV